MIEEPKEIVIDPPVRGLRVSAHATCCNWAPVVDEPERTTKVVTVIVTATFHGDHLASDEVAGHLTGWIDSGLNDRDDLREWKTDTGIVVEIHGDPNGYDSDEQPDWGDCADGGDWYPEHDFDEIQCKRCGAEPDGYEED